MTIESGPNSIPPSNRENGTTGSRQKNYEIAHDMKKRIRPKMNYDMKKRIRPKMNYDMKKRARPKKKYDMKNRARVKRNYEMNQRAPPKKKYDMNQRARPKRNGSKTGREAKIVYDIRAKLDAEAPANLEIWHAIQQPPNPRRIYFRPVPRIGRWSRSRPNRSCKTTCPQNLGVEDLVNLEL